MKKGPENRKNEVKLRPPSVPPPVIMRNILCEFDPQFGQTLSHHAMPKVLVLKAPGRHVMSCLLGVIWSFLAEKKDHIT